MDNNIQIGKLEEQVNETKEILKNNCNKVIERDERLGLLEDRAEALTMNSNIFQVKSKRLKNKMWIKSKLCYFISFFILILIIIIIVIENKKN
jgi:hypothetical protein